MSQFEEKFNMRFNPSYFLNHGTQILMNGKTFYIFLHSEDGDSITLKIQTKDEPKTGYEVKYNDIDYKIISVEPTDQLCSLLKMKKENNG